MTDHTLLSTDKSSPKIAIIGGGLTGLLTATLLERILDTDNVCSNAPHITIFEKSRSVGRLATRYRTDSETGRNCNGRLGHSSLRQKPLSSSNLLPLG